MLKRPVRRLRPKDPATIANLKSGAYKFTPRRNKPLSQTPEARAARTEYRTNKSTISRERKLAYQANKRNPLWVTKHRAYQKAWQVKRGPTSPAGRAKR